MKGRGYSRGRTNGRGRGVLRGGGQFPRSPSRRSTLSEEFKNNTSKMEAMEITQNETNERNYKYLLNNIPTIKYGTKGWENIETLKETILTLTKICAISNNKKEQDYILAQIQKYEKRCKELDDYANRDEPRDENEKMEEMDGTEEIPQWDDVHYISNELKKYQIQAHQKRNEPSTTREPTTFMIKLLNKRLATLLDEATMQNLESEKNTLPNYEKIREASDIAFYDKEEWHNLTYVHKMTLELQIEQTKEPNEKQRKDIGKIANKYMMREKNIIEMMVEYDTKLINEGTIKIDETTGDVSMNENITIIKDENNEIKIISQDGEGNKKRKTNNTTGEKSYNIKNAMSDDETIDSNDTKSLAESAKEINTTCESMDLYEALGEQVSEKEKTLSSLSKANQRVQENKEYINAADMKAQSYSDITKNNMIGTTRQQCSKEGIIRIRFQFRADNIPVGKKFGEQIKSKLHDIMMCTKLIDRNTYLLPWKENSTVAPLHGKEITLLANESMKEYVAAPRNPECLTRDKFYYHFGLRLKTNVPVQEFTEQWNNNKYNNTGKYPILKWVSMKPAEMQSSSTAYAVGYFIGSTERGDYRTLNETLAKITDVKTEASFQTVNQHKVSSIIWGSAIKIAEKHDVNPKSKAHKSMKYKASPAALIVYVEKKEYIKDIRRLLYDEYGIIEDENNWPTLPDGSKMVFSPILRGHMNDEVIDDLTDSMELHVDLKVDEILLDIEVKDIHTNQTYMKNQSLEQIIHGTKVKINETTEIPMFKHLCRKWMMDTSITRYQVAVQKQIVETAKKYIVALEENLKTTYGEQISTHFFRKNTNANINRQSSQKKNNEIPTSTNEEEDSEIINCIRKNKKGGIYGKVMLTGMNILNQNEMKIEDEQPKAMLIHISNSDESMSGVTSSSKSSQGTISWDKDVQGRELTCERVHENEREKIMKCCAKYDIKSEELREWIKNNIQDKNDPINEWNMTQLQEYVAYDRWKTMIIDIKAERTRKYKEKLTNDEYNNPEMDAAISSMPSNEWEPNTSTQHPASHLPNEKLSHDPINKENKNRDAESGRQ